MTSDKKRDYNPVSSTTFPRFPLGPQAALPKAQRACCPSFSLQSCFVVHDQSLAYGLEEYP
jgi:hypothetical protein